MIAVKTSFNVAPDKRIIPQPMNVAVARLISSPYETLSPWASMTMSTIANSTKNAAAVRKINPPMTENTACVVVCWFLVVLIAITFTIVKFLKSQR